MSLDSFLDIVSNVVGVLILVAVVVVLGAGDVSISSGATATRTVKSSAPRVVFELRDERAYFLDEEANGQRVVAAVKDAYTDREPSVDDIVAALNGTDVGDATYRVRAEPATDGGIAWMYRMRASATGESCAELSQSGSKFLAQLERLPQGGFVYFIVREDSFELFRCARDVAKRRGLEFGWHPVEGKEPLRFSVGGDLGRRIQ